MHDREKVISHLQIIHTWASFALENDINFFNEAHMNEMTEWTEDAIKLIKEQETEIERLHAEVERIISWR